MASVTETVSRSTLTVLGAMWLISVGLLTWLLVSMVEVKENTRGLLVKGEYIEKRLDAKDRKDDEQDRRLNDLDARVRR